MKHHGMIAIVFVVGCATGGVAAQLVVPPVRAGTEPARWEYQCLRVGTETEAGVMTSTLNKLGADGWDLVSNVPAHTTAGGYVTAYMLCAKRALP